MVLLELIKGFSIDEVYKEYDKYSDSNISVYPNVINDKIYLNFKIPDLLFCLKNNEYLPLLLDFADLSFRLRSDCDGDNITEKGRYLKDFFYSIYNIRTHKVEEIFYMFGKIGDSRREFSMYYLERNYPFVTDSGYVYLGSKSLDNTKHRLKLMGFEDKFINNLITI